MTSRSSRPALVLAGPLAVWLASATAGCMYTGALNDRPSAEIDLAIAEARRGDLVTAGATIDDPNGDEATAIWRVYACAAPEVCDPVPFLESTDLTIAFAVPFQRADASAVEQLRFDLEVRDSYGAVAAPAQQEFLAIGNAAPTGSLQAAGLTQDGAFPVGATIDLFGAFTDLDDGTANLTFAWTLWPARDSDPAVAQFTPLAVIEPGQPRATLRPDVAGVWRVDVVATDPVGAQTPVSLAVVVADDQAPCIGVTAPQIIDGVRQPLDAPTAFVVRTVADELDPFPGDTDPTTELGVATFAWFASIDGAPVTPVAAAGNQIALEPSQYPVGTLIDLRVEVADRVDRGPWPCAEDAPQCSRGSNGCMQRQSWRLEVR